MNVSKKEGVQGKLTSRVSSAPTSPKNRSPHKSVATTANIGKSLSGSSPAALSPSIDMDPDSFFNSLLSDSLLGKEEESSSSALIEKVKKLDSSTRTKKERHPLASTLVLEEEEALWHAATSTSTVASSSSSSPLVSKSIENFLTPADNSCCIVCTPRPHQSFKQWHTNKLFLELKEQKKVFKEEFNQLINDNKLRLLFYLVLKNLKNNDGSKEIELVADALDVDIIKDSYQQLKQEYSKTFSFDEFKSLIQTFVKSGSFFQSWIGQYLENKFLYHQFLDPKYKIPPKKEVAEKACLENEYNVFMGDELTLQHQNKVLRIAGIDAEALVESLKENFVKLNQFFLLSEDPEDGFKCWLRESLSKLLPPRDSKTPSPQEWAGGFICKVLANELIYKKFKKIIDFNSGLQSIESNNFIDNILAPYKKNWLLLLKEQKQHSFERMLKLPTFYKKFLGNIVLAKTVLNINKAGAGDSLKRILQKLVSNAHIESNDKNSSSNYFYRSNFIMGRDKNKCSLQPFKDSLYLLGDSADQVEAAHTLPFPALFSWSEEKILEYVKDEFKLSDDEAKELEAGKENVALEKGAFNNIKRGSFDINRALNIRLAKLLDSHKNDIPKVAFETIRTLKTLYLPLFSETENLPKLINQVDWLTEPSLKGKPSFKQMLSIALSKLIEEENSSEESIKEALGPYFTSAQKAMAEEKKKLKNFPLIDPYKKVLIAQTHQSLALNNDSPISLGTEKKKVKRPRPSPSNEKEKAL